MSEGLCADLAPLLVQTYLQHLLELRHRAMSIGILAVTGLHIIIGEFLKRHKHLKIPIMDATSNNYE